jgi:hypothetical protein
MEQSNDIVAKVVREIAISPPNSATAAGQTDDPALVDTINQIFALFRINFHNQFYSAFNEVELLNQAKRLWLDSLRQYPVGCLLKAARQIIEQSEYLPTLHKMLEACDLQSNTTGLPSTRDAYMEACLAPHPKTQHTWSHAAVYHAGNQTGWYQLENQPEYLSWPSFKRNYEDYKHRALRGEDLDIEIKPLIEDAEKTTLSKAERLRQLKKLRNKLQL